jgi:hypothetical protein
LPGVGVPSGGGGHGTLNGRAQKAPKTTGEPRARKINEFCNTIEGKPDMPSRCRDGSY